MQSTEPILLGGFSCTGQESNLLSCGHYSTDVFSECKDHSYDGAVKCEGMHTYTIMIISLMLFLLFIVPCINGSIRLNLRDYYYGRVEVCVNEVWGLICYEYWDFVDASVVCRELGFSPYGIDLASHHGLTLLSKQVHHQIGIILMP